MFHFLPLIAFTHTWLSCYGKITTKDVCRSIWKALFFDDSLKKSRKSQHCVGQYFISFKNLNTS